MKRCKRRSRDFLEMVLDWPNWEQLNFLSVFIQRQLWLNPQDLHNGRCQTAHWMCMSILAQEMSQ